MGITIALAGNPNSGKTTLFNELTGSHQYVGNWPGVTVEKKTGEYKKNRDIKITDLPGIYSLSPYTLEEVISRDYLLNEKPDVIIDVIDASNIERNLYLATQLSELGIPLILALNMMDLVKQYGDKINSKKLEELLACKVVEISALKNQNIDELINVAKIVAADKNRHKEIKGFSEEVERGIQSIQDNVSSIKNNPAKRWLAIKIFEEDEKILKEIDFSLEEKRHVEEIIKTHKEKFEDDGEGIITDERYNFVTKITKDSVKKGRKGLTISDKIDRILTNRILSLPIFIAIMSFVYYISVTIVGGDITDWVNDDFFGEIIGGALSGLLDSMGVSDWLHSLIMDGAFAGVSGVLGFLPIIATLFLFIAILEDVGYMSRIAFILDRAFRKFGLSGKSFIPILIGTGCSVPGIIGTRTIENDKDRRMTITVASMMPCGAKTDIIAMFGAVVTGVWWFGPIWYFGGILAVIITGLILKKTSMFKGDPAPFIMELPEYHLPKPKNILKATWFRVKSFIVKAGTIILLASIIIWALQNISTTGEFVTWDEGSTQSVLSFLGQKVAWIFEPLGFGNWMAAVATVVGLIAKEMVVGTFGVLANLGEVEAGSEALNTFITSNFTMASILSFTFYNQFTIPCFAALGAISQEMGDRKWTAFAVMYILTFSYTVSLMIYQFSRVLIDGQPFTYWTGIALGILAFYLYLIFRPVKEESVEKGMKESWEI